MQASKEIGRPIVHEFSREALAEAGATHTVPPFSIVSSNTMDLSVGRCVWYTQPGPLRHGPGVHTCPEAYPQIVMTCLLSYMRVSSSLSTADQCKAVQFPRRAVRQSCLCQFVASILGNIDIDAANFTNQRTGPGMAAVGGDKAVFAGFGR